MGASRHQAARTGPRAPRIVGAPASPILTAQEAASYLRLSLRTFYRAVRAGRIPCAREGKVLRFHRDALDAWAKGGVAWGAPDPSATPSDRFFTEFNSAFARLRKDKGAWKEELGERRAWDSTLGDGQGSEEGRPRG